MSLILYLLEFGRVDRPEQVDIEDLSLSVELAPEAVSEAFDGSGDSNIVGNAVTL